MIQKPPGADREEEESRAHAAVGKAIDVLPEIREATKQTARVAGGCYGTWLLALAPIFVLISSTPWWFKLLCLAGIGWLFYRKWKRFRFWLGGETR